MATKSPAPEVDVKCEVQLLGCPLCGEIFKNPRSLPCEHSFCSSCLQADMDRKAIDDAYTCPVCHEEVKVPSNGAAGFRRNSILKNVVDSVNITTDAEKMCDPCAVVDKQEEALSMCVDCREMLCRPCGDVHTRFRVTSNHTVITLEDVQQGKHDAELRANQQVSCQNHDRVARYYCNECKQLICVDCVNLGSCAHVGSRYTVYEMSRTTSKLLEDHVKLLIKTVENRDENKDKSNKNLQDTSRTFQKYKKVVNKTVDNLIAHLQAARKSHLAETEDKVNMAKKEIQNHKQILEDTTETLKRTIGQVESLLKYATLTEMLLYKERLENVQDVTGDVVGVAAPYNAEFIPNESLVDKILDLSQSLGDTIVKPHCILQFNSKQPGEEDGNSRITGICVLPPRGDIVTVDSYNNKLKLFERDGNYKSEFSQFSRPWNCVVTPEGNMYVSECSTDKIHTVTPGGKVIDAWEVGGLLPQPLGSLQSGMVRYIDEYPPVIAWGAMKQPHGLAVNWRNDVIFTSYESPGFRVLSSHGEVMRAVSQNGKGEDMFKFPGHVTVNSKNEIIVSDRGLNNVYFLSEDGGQFNRSYQPNQECWALDCPRGVCTDKSDNVYVCDSKNNRVLLLTPFGEFCKVLLSKEDGLRYPCVVTFDLQGHLVVGQYNGLVKIFKIEY